MLKWEGPELQMHPPAKSFEELWVWQQAKILVRQIYTDFGRPSAAGHDFAFQTQIHRAAMSIMNNIAEGVERGTNAEFVRFLDYSKGSCGEVRSMLYSAEDLSYLLHDLAEERRQFASRLSAGIAKLMSSLS
jgi:four helix bundle protein